ncbi:Hint domain-containing protein [Mesobaculum littorinae]|nr:Hint domain-containing protein [Mesobaculum littorinae]
MRRYDISWMLPSGDSQSTALAAPAIPMFEEAFGGFGRGAMVTTSEGPVAVEDLVPGMMVETSHGREPLLWIGAITLVPDPTGEPPVRMFRLPADAFGLDRPAPDLMLGPAARLVNRAPRLRAAMKTDAALTPVSAMVDGTRVIQITPISAMRTFHLGFAGHQTLSVSGIEVESFHPGTLNLAQLGTGIVELFMSLFPHLSGVEAFGPLCMPRLTEEDLEWVQVA